MQIKDTLTLVTGGGSGLGRGCVEKLISLGARVVVWDKEISSSLPQQVIVDKCDVASEDSVKESTQRLINGPGIPRILIQCAGILGQGRMVGKNGPLPMEQFKKVIEVNLIGTFQVMQAIVAQMMTLDKIAEERGVVINTASIAAFEGQIGQMAYSASKGGVVAMTLPAARELAPFGIRVNTIAPGLMETPMLQGMTDELQARLKTSFVFPERLGKPEEFGALAVHMIENPLLNGEVIRLDGGIRLAAR